MNPKYSYRDKSGVTHHREIVGEFAQYGKRVYEIIDPVTKEEHTALSDEIDQTFFPKRGAILPRKGRGFQGINGRRRR